MSDFGFLIDVSIIIFSFFFFYKIRNILAKVLMFSRLPIFLLAILTTIPFIVIEESINCIDHGDGLGCRMTTWINVVLLIEVTILLYIVKKKKITSIKKPLIYFGVVGLLWEIVAGGLVGWLLHPFILFMGPYMILSYAYLALIPVTIMTLYNKKISSNQINIKKNQNL
jgi:hypothetical protein